MLLQGGMSMEYVRLTGEGGAFGWQSAQDGVWQLTLGGCAAGECLVIGEAGTRRITPDAGGAFRGDTACGRALCVAALPEGALLAYDVQRLSRQEARILCRERTRPAVPVRQEQTETAPNPVLPEPVQIEEALPEIAEQARKKEAKPEIYYRDAPQTPPVDALPVLEWPGTAQKLRPYFEKNRPLRLFDWPQWRMIRWQHMGGAPCYVGVRVGERRVTAVLYAVQARGGMLPPKGLAGYRYQRAADGKGYWTLIQEV